MLFLTSGRCIMERFPSIKLTSPLSCGLVYCVLVPLVRSHGRDRDCFCLVVATSNRVAQCIGMVVIDGIRPASTCSGGRMYASLASPASEAPLFPTRVSGFWTDIFHPHSRNAYEAGILTSLYDCSNPRTAVARHGYTGHLPIITS